MQKSLLTFITLSSILKQRTASFPGLTEMKKAIFADIVYYYYFL